MVEALGLDKDLDDAAGEFRETSTCDLIQAVEDACGKAIADDCGRRWADLLLQAWFRARAGIQHFAAGADVSLLESATAEQAIRCHLILPLAADFLDGVFRQAVAPELAVWWNSPIAAWVDLACARCGVGRTELLASLGNELEVDARTLERWMAGVPSREIAWPFQPKVCGILNSACRPCAGPTADLTEDDLRHLAGWLMVAVAFQSIEGSLRDDIRRSFKIGGRPRWNAGSAVEVVNAIGVETSNRPERIHAMHVMLEAEALFEEQPARQEAVRAKLAEFEVLFLRDQVQWHPAYRGQHDWLSARLAAVTGDHQCALDLYARAVRVAWWRSGPNQQLLLKEALLHGAGCANKVAAERYWDKIHLLGLNRWPKSVLDDQELRRLSVAFERMFAPQKACMRVPPVHEVLYGEKHFEISRQAAKAPNARVKHADGRTRRTPLMDAVRRGTLADVEQLLQLGGDPDSHIPESGEGPLTCSMRRAWRSHDAAIMQYLLGTKLSEETVNRPASTMRETPLKLAIEIGDAKVVDRLINLGARIEDPCGHLPSALCYALALYQSSLQGIGDQLRGYWQGETHADIYDAKKGAVLDAELPEARADLPARLMAHAENWQIAEEVWSHLLRPASQYREVVLALLRRSADPNRVYRSSPYAAEDWTPTLFAAQIGDIDVLRAMVDHGGDAYRTLTGANGLDRMDALWIAVAYGRSSVIDYLSGLRKSTC